jgi:hypothetical protein
MVFFAPQPSSLALVNPTTRHAQPAMISTSPRKSKVLASSDQVVRFRAGRFKLKYKAGMAIPHVGKLM